MISANEPLPPGYTSETTPHVNREQIATMYHPKYTHWSEAQHIVNSYRWLDAHYEMSGIHSEYFEVTSVEGESVGVGCLRYDAWEAELSCLSVLPNHRGQGIGKWLIDERIRRAEMQGVQRLYVRKLDVTNTLASYYMELGFVERGGTARVSIFAAGPSVTAEPHLVLHR